MEAEGLFGIQTLLSETTRLPYFTTRGHEKSMHSRVMTLRMLYAVSRAAPPIKASDIVPQDNPIGGLSRILQHSKWTHAISTNDIRVSRQLRWPFMNSLIR